MENENIEIENNKYNNNSDSKDNLENCRNEAKKIRTKKKKLITGFILLAIVIIITVGSSIWIKDVYKEYPKPFAFTYFDTLFLAFLIVIYYIKKFIKSKISYFNKNDDYQQVAPAEVEQEHNLTNFSEGELSKQIQKIKRNRITSYNKRFHKWGLILMMFWYFGNAFYNLGLNNTSITSSNTLSNTAIVFIFLIKVIFFGSKCEIIKIIATVLAGIGIFFIGRFESTIAGDTQNDSFIGDVYVLIGALFYSIYTVLLQRFSKQNAKHFDMMEMFGYIGLYNLLFIPVVLIVIHFTTIEVFIIPTFSDILNIFINALVSGIIADLLQNYAIILLSPIMVSFGLTFSIPLSFLWDFFKGKIEFSYEYLLGSIFIFSSFILMIWGKFRKASMKKIDKEPKV